MVEKELNNKSRLNLLGLEKNEYKGENSTLCRGCGHNSISNQIISACFDLNLIPEQIVKFSGIGCSSKSPNYFLSRSFGFNGLHGRMPSLATGALFGDTSLKGIGISGDGDTASIGLGQFKHLVRRNVPMTYIVENNGVYGLTKGQFSATSEKGLRLKRQGINPYMPVDICMEALVANATFVARSFAGDPKQVKELIKSAIGHNGIAVIDIISPCVTFHNKDAYLHSYSWGKLHEIPLHEVSYVPPRDEIFIEDFIAGETREVDLHNGSYVVLKKLELDYDPTNRWKALSMLEEAHQKEQLVTGLIYVDPQKPSFFDMYDLPETPLNRIPSNRLRPTKQSLIEINKSLT